MARSSKYRLSGKRCCRRLNASVMASCRTLRFDPFGCLGAQLTPCNFQIVMRLQIDPEFWAVAEVKPKPECRIGRDSASVVDDLGNPVRRNADRLRQLVLRQIILGEKFLSQDLARADRRKLARRISG